jgi:hypothetical protein
VRFLTEPGVAARQSRDGYRPVRADQDQALHPALRGLVEAQSEFAAWVPSALCFFYVDSVTVGGRTVAEKNARKAQLVSVWTIATSEQGRGTRRDLVLDISASNSRVVRNAEAVKLRIREGEVSVSRPPDKPDEVHNTKIGKTRLVWTGRVAGDSSKVEQPIEEAWLVRGASGSAWNVALSFKPEWSRPLVGALSVEGKDDLAKTLKASPIRFVGPRYLGGGADLVFSR